MTQGESQNVWIDQVFNINGLVQERRNSIGNALQLRPSCTNPSMIRHSICWFSGLFLHTVVTLEDKTFKHADKNKKCMDEMIWGPDSVSRFTYTGI